MNKTSLKSRIVRYVSRKGDWVNGATIERLAMEAGFKASNASRRCRELANEGIFERKEEGSVYYRYKGLPQKTKEPSEMSSEELRAYVQ
jgi:DNA-binding Lrp family transcriptional regulator